MSAKKVLGAVLSPFRAIFGDKAFRIVAGIGLAVAGVLTGQFQLVAAGIGLAASGLKGKPRVSTNALDRLTASMDPHAGRKIWLGHTAGATDVRYQAATGDDQEYIHWIMVAASHTVEGATELWFDTQKAWSSAGGVEDDFDDYLTVAFVNPGTDGNGIAIDTKWTADCTLTGCAYFHIRFKLTGNSKKAESPFAQSLPTRITVRGKGALLPDIRETGCEADDQATWDWFDDDSGRNPALQMLFYLIGWRINGKLAVGRGLPVSRIDLDSFITAANLCDETVNKAAGGTEPRYRSDGLFSENDDPSLVIGNLCSAMNAVIRDTGGRLAVHCLHNDLATPVAAFSEADILGDDEWVQTPPVDEFFNIVRGQYVDPSDAALYQLVDYPEIEIASVDDIERIDTFPLAVVQSASQAQRLAKQRLQRNLYRGVFSAKFNERGWQVNLGDPVTLSHLSLGWDDKLFRVAAHSIGLDGVVEMVLTEEHEDIYAWDAEEAPAVAVAAPTAYDPLNSPLIQALQELETLGIVGYLTNEAHTVPASSAGVVSSYAGASGEFIVLQGGTDVSDQFTLSTKSGGNPQSLSVTYNNSANPRTYSVTAGIDAGEDGALLTVRATGSGSFTGIVIDKVFSLAKSVAGAGGAPAKLMTLSSDRQIISYDETGALSPSSQTIIFTANKQNTTNTVSWTLSDSLGNSLTAAYFSATTGNSVTMTAANFDAAITVNGAQGLIITATVSADSLSDKSSVLKVQKGATGATGANAKTVTVTSNRDAFTFDGGGNLSPGTQAAVVTANPQNFVGGNVVWSYADNLATSSATLAALVTNTSTNVRTVPSTVFTGTPTRAWLRVTATGQGAESGLSDATTIHRLQDGASVLTMLLSNEAHNVPTDAAGASGDFSGAVGQIKVFWGTTDVTASSTLSEVSETGCTGDVNTATNTPFTGAKGAYRVTALSADSGIYKMRAVYDPGSGNVTVDKDFSVTKSKTGAAGVNAIVGYLTNDNHTLPAANDGTVSSYSGATGSFKVFSGTTDVSSSFALSTQANPQSLTIGYVSQAYTVTAGFDAGEDSATVTIRATGSGAYSGIMIDKVFTLGKSKGGATGAGGPVIALAGDAEAFTFTDGAADPGVQTITFNATRQNTSETVNFSTSPSVTLGGSGLTRTLTVANFGSSRQVVVTATGATSGAADTITVVRLERWTDLAGLDATAAAEIAALTTTVDAAVDDNILDRAEKKELLKLVGQMQARHTNLLARASALGVSTGNAASSKSTFETYLVTLPIAWDDVDQDTPLSINLSPPIASWANTGTTFSQGDVYATVGDDSTGARENLLGTVAVTAGQNYTFGIPIRKDAIGGATRVPLVQFTAINGTAKTATVSFDTTLGPASSQLGGTGGGAIASGVYVLSDEIWLAWATMSVSATTTSLGTQLIPANSTNNWTPNNAIMGTVDVMEPSVVFGGFNQLGRYAYRYLLRAWQNELEKLAKAISEQDAARALTISGPATSTVTSKSDGTFDTGVLPKEVGFQLGDGAGGNSTASATWARTLKSGSATSSISIVGSNAVLSVSALGATSEWEITATIGGVIVARYVHRMTKIVTQAASSGGSGGTTGTGPITGGNSSTAYVVIVATIRAKAGAAGQVACFAPIEFTCVDDLNDASISSTAKWQWRVIAGAYADITTAIAASATAAVEDQGFGAYFRTAGTIDCNMTKTGLTNGVEYEFQCVAKVDESSRSLVFSGQGGTNAQCVGT